MTPPPVGSVVASTMLLLPSDKMSHLRDDFQANQNGLSLTQFVSTMIEHTIGEDAEEDKKIALVADLCELFAQVDVNGDGTMDWEEFTKFMIEQAFAIGQEETFYDRYEERGGDEGAAGLAIGRNISFMKYLDSQHKLFVAVEGVLRLVDVFGDRAPAVEAEIDTGQALPAAPPPGQAAKDRAKKREAQAAAAAAAAAAEGGGGEAAGGEAAAAAVAEPTSAMARAAARRGRRGYQGEEVARPTALGLAFLPEEDLYCAVLSDLSIAFFTREFLHLSGKVDTGNSSRNDPSHAVGQQYHLAWGAQARLLFTCGAAPAVHAWAVTYDPELKRHGLAHMHRLRRHTDMVQALMVIDWDDASLLVSAGLDRKIHLWSTEKPQWQGTRAGHQAGVRSLAYDPRGEGLLLSAGFERDVLVWDVWGTLPHPLLRLVGHRAPVLRVEAAGGTGRAASIDQAGTLIWWDVRRAAAGSAEGGGPAAARCLQALDLRADRPRHLALCHGAEGAQDRSSNGVTLAAAGRKLRLLDCRDSRPPEPPLRAALYCGASLTFATANGRDLKVWDAATRTMLRWYENLAPSEITSICFDGRQRKIIIATQDGHVGVYNYLNGALMHALPPHRREVSAMLYAAEDKCLITTSWDRSLHIYDEVAKPEEEPLLRTVAHCHAADVLSLAFSHDLGLVASGAADGTLRCWDFQFAFLDGEFRCEDPLWAAHAQGGAAAAGEGEGAPLPGGAGSEVTALAFVDPYPLLLAADAAGRVHLVPVRPYLGEFHRYQSMGHFLNDPAEAAAAAAAAMEGGGAADAGVAAPITCLKVHFLPGGGGALGGGAELPRFLVLTGDENGELVVWDLSRALRKLRLRAVPDKDLPSRMGSYNPRRRTARDNKNQGAKPTRGKSRRVRSRQRHLDAALKLGKGEKGGGGDADAEAERAYRLAFRASSPGDSDGGDGGGAAAAPRGGGGAPKGGGGGGGRASEASVESFGDGRAGRRSPGGLPGAPGSPPAGAWRSRRVTNASALTDRGADEALLPGSPDAGPDFVNVVSGVPGSPIDAGFEPEPRTSWWGALPDGTPARDPLADGGGLAALRRSLAAAGGGGGGGGAGAAAAGAGGGGGSGSRAPSQRASLRGRPSRGQQRGRSPGSRQSVRISGPSLLRWQTSSFLSDVELQMAVTQKDVDCLAEWGGHRGNCIQSLEIVSENLFVTGAADRSVKLWRFDANDPKPRPSLQGILTLGMELDTKFQIKQWNFPIDFEARLHAQRENAKKILRELAQERRQAAALAKSRQLEKDSLELVLSAPPTAAAAATAGREEGRRPRRGPRRRRRERSPGGGGGGGGAAAADGKAALVQLGGQLQRMRRRGPDAAGGEGEDGGEGGGGGGGGIWGGEEEGGADIDEEYEAILKQQQEDGFATPGFEVSNPGSPSIASSSIGTLQYAKTTLGITDNEEEAIDKERSRTRVLGQLEGKQTWNKSQWEMAREEAMKSQEEVRLKREKSRKSKRKKRGGKGRKDSSLEELDDDGGGGDDHTASPTAPHDRDNLRKFDPDPADPDNWHISSLNRQRALYGHLHAERRRAEAGADRARPARGDDRLLRKLAQPSRFLQRHLPGLAAGQAAAVDPRRRATRQELRARARTRQRRTSAAALRRASLKAPPPDFGGGGPRASSLQGLLPGVRENHDGFLGEEEAGGVGPRSTSARRATARGLASSRSAPVLETIQSESRLNIASAPNLPQFPPIEEGRKTHDGYAGMQNHHQILASLGPATVRPRARTTALLGGGGGGGGPGPPSPIERAAAAAGDGAVAGAGEASGGGGEGAAAAGGGPARMSLGDLQGMGRRRAAAQRRWQRKIEGFLDLAEARGVVQEGDGLDGKVARQTHKKTYKLKQKIHQRAVGLVQLQAAGHEAKQKRQSHTERAGELMGRTHFGPHHKQELLAFYQAFRDAAAAARRSREASGLSQDSEAEEEEPGPEEERADLHALMHTPLVRGSRPLGKALKRLLMDPETRKKGATVPFGGALGACFPLLRRKERRELFQLLELLHPRRGRAEKKEEVAAVPPEKLAEMRLLFDLYDEDKGGTVDLEEIKAALTGGGGPGEDAITEAELEKIMAQFDDDGNLELDFDEFVQAFKDVF